ncbi:hypothetical protein BDW16_3132 [Sphingomonas koreensis]|nr:hypothetical protein BDW16_3132 [Sphingomonas koreensis]
MVTLCHYFPDAMLTDAGLNRALLGACRLPADSRRRFIASSNAAIAEHGPYDAIFCMAVLTLRPREVEDRDVRNIAAFYPFAHFAQALRLLAAQLARGGVLVVEQAHYRAEDALARTGAGGRGRPRQRRALRSRWRADRAAAGDRAYLPPRLRAVPQLRGPPSSPPAIALCAAG